MSISPSSVSSSPINELHLNLHDEVSEKPSETGGPALSLEQMVGSYEDATGTPDGGADWSLTGGFHDSPQYSTAQPGFLSGLDSDSGWDDGAGVGEAPPNLALPADGENDTGVVTINYGNEPSFGVDDMPPAPSNGGENDTGIVTISYGNEPGHVPSDSTPNGTVDSSLFNVGLSGPALSMAPSDGVRHGIDDFHFSYSPPDPPPSAAGSNPGVDVNAFRALRPPPSLKDRRAEAAGEVKLLQQAAVKAKAEGKIDAKPARGPSNFMAAMAAMGQQRAAEEQAKTPEQLAEQNAEAAALLAAVMPKSVGEIAKPEVLAGTVTQPGLGEFAGKAVANGPGTVQKQTKNVLQKFAAWCGSIANSVSSKVGAFRSWIGQLTSRNLQPISRTPLNQGTEAWGQRVRHPVISSPGLRGGSGMPFNPNEAA